MDKKENKKEKGLTTRKETSLARRNEDLSVNQRNGFEFDYGYDRLDQTMKLCESIAQSGMVPKEYANASKKVLVASAMGARFGMDPLQSLQSIAVVNGSPTFYGDALPGIVKSSGLEEFTYEGVKAMEYAAKASDIYKTWLKHYEYKPSRIAFCVTKRKGEEPVIQHFTLDQAKEAGLLSKDNWRKHPMRMLQLRARSFALRDAYPDVLKGYKTYEEMQDVADQDRYQVEPLPEVSGEFIETDEWNEQEEEAETVETTADEHEEEEEEIANELLNDIDELETLSEDWEDEEQEDSLQVSSDMNAPDAIESIRQTSTLDELIAFFDPEDDRITVQEAFSTRERELEKELSEASTQETKTEKKSPAPAEKKSEPEQASFGDFDNPTEPI